jgi:hypothetical protein
VLTCANAAGTHRLDLLVIGKSRRPRALKNVTSLPVQYKSQTNAWMDRSIFLDWFHCSFVPAVKKHLSQFQNHRNSKCLLLLDNCKAHPPINEMVSKCGNIFVMCFPPNRIF